ncbi:uncharacterized protein LOC113549221 [Rhopalosiphum maidis]|uniref:uncharacterized protein LOC113549221 n=1 Tax=Rhopalosiphum maidis TaxID=43146 RepID=UPI000EFDDAE6|nr:uncharacterized protein LOC113549221 [Rhopalosiphum maidis]
MMTCQQLTTVCIFMTTCQIVPGQLFSNIQRHIISSQYPNSMLIYGVLRRPPDGYHYETIKHILNTYPKNSYQIRHGLANTVNQNNRGSSSPDKNKGFKKSKKKSKNKNSKNNNDNDGSDAGDGGGLPPDDSTLPDATPPDADAPADSQPLDSDR